MAQHAVFRRLVRRDGVQSVEIPPEMALESDEVCLHREGSRLVIEPVPMPSLLTVLAQLKPIDEPFPDIDDDLPALDDVSI